MSDFKPSDWELIRAGAEAAAKVFIKSQSDKDYEVCEYSDLFEMVEEELLEGLAFIPNWPVITSVDGFKVVVFTSVGNAIGVFIEDLGPPGDGSESTVEFVGTVDKQRNLFDLIEEACSKI